MDGKMKNKKKQQGKNQETGDTEEHHVEIDEETLPLPESSSVPEYICHIKKAINQLPGKRRITIIFVE